MSTLSICLILTLIQLSIFFYLKSNILNLKFFNYIDYSNSMQNEGLEEVEIPIKEISKPVVFTKKLNT